MSATLLRNKTPGFLPVPASYGGGMIAPGKSVIIADTVANVTTVFGNPLSSYVDISAVPAGQTANLSPEGGGGAQGVSYTPGVAGNWPVAPTTVSAALDDFAAKSAAQGRIFLGRQIITATGTYTPNPLANRVLLKMVGSGGGGGGVANSSAGQVAVGAGGASGSYFEKWIDPAAAIVGGAATVGAAGTAGANTGAAGGTGGDVSLVVNSVTYTAKGGPGGGFVASSASNVQSQGGGFVTGTSAGDVATAQEPGGAGQGFGGTIGTSGWGGSSPWGAGGAHAIAAGAGNAGHGNGAGGSGGLSINASGAVTGGAGTIGLIIVDEYS
jgi:hypothetical protein